MPASSRSSLKIHATAEVGKRYIADIRQQLQRAHRILHPPLAELSLALVNDARMSRLHKQFMDIPGPTDVLTFPLELGSDGQTVAGEVVVCVPEARRRAAIEGVTVDRE